MSSRRDRRLLRALVAAACVAALGCGPTLYTVQILPAARAIEEAREAGAEEHAPYEYHYALVHLDKAREESGEASYQDAIRYAETAREFGTKARDLARDRMRERGR